MESFESQMSRLPLTSHLESLLARIRSGDDTARDDLIRDAYPRALKLSRLIMRGEMRVGQQLLTDDICVISYEKFAQAFKKDSSVSFANLRQMLAYLGSIIRNTATDEIRSLLGTKRATQFPQNVLRPEGAAVVETRLRFYEMIEGLSEEEKDIIEMKYLWEYKDREIAALLGISRTQVRRELHSAMIRLKRDYDLIESD